MIVDGRIAGLIHLGIRRGGLPEGVGVVSTGGGRVVTEGKLKPSTGNGNVVAGKE